MTETETKIAAARDAIDQAAALLLEHAEGLCMLAMMARFREEHPAEVERVERGVEAILAPAGPVIRNCAADIAYWHAAAAAAQFAGRFEAFQQARDIPCELTTTLREEVEKLVDDTGSLPPVLSRVPATAGHAELGITPRQVHAQAWRSHLAASAARITRVEVGTGRSEG